MFCNAKSEVLKTASMKIYYPGIWHCVNWYIVTDIFEETAASIFRVVFLDYH
jgi:hypothetical protein